MNFAETLLRDVRYEFRMLRTSPGFTAGSMFPTTTPCDCSAACCPRAGCQPIASAHAPAASHTPLPTTRTAFREICICASFCRVLISPAPAENTHPFFLKRQNPRKGSTRARQIPLPMNPNNNWLETNLT